jgi:hypothetical protein
MGLLERAGQPSDICPRPDANDGYGVKASGVLGACTHDTLATEVLEMGGTFEEAADILGDTEAIVRNTTRNGALGGRRESLTCWHVLAHEEIGRATD